MSRLQRPFRARGLAWPPCHCRAAAALEAPHCIGRHHPQRLQRRRELGCQALERAKSQNTSLECLVPEE